ncbi:hypothetical protein Tco_1263056 [Tanacetum coccineum]
MELHNVSYGIEYVARPFLLFFSSENQLLWFRYREYDLAPLKLIFEFSIYNVWKSIQYGVSNGLDMTYWGFLRVGTTFDIFQNIILIPYLEYGVLSPLDTAYWSSEYFAAGRIPARLSIILTAFSSLFYGADYSFVSTTFIPPLGIEANELGFRYEIEIASGQLVAIDKVIQGCKLEIEGHVFDIDLIRFGHESFDVIIVVRIPLLDDNVLRVLGKRPKEKARLLISAKASDKKQEEIVVVRDFLEVFLDDLSGLPPLREIELRIELIPRAVPVAKSPSQHG